MKRENLLGYLDTLLQPGKWRDYCPNGLQVEGRPEIRKIIAGVTASQLLLDCAVDRESDAVLVHHGYFWKGEDSRLTGLKRQRLKTLLSHDINLIAFHLPLDAHPELGNNAQWAKAMGWEKTGHFGEQEIGWIGHAANTDDAILSVAQWQDRLTQALQRTPLLIGDAHKPVRRIAWCSGGAQDYFADAIDAGADLYVTGEVSEPCTHLARESGVAYLAAGHHATERYGIRALATHLRETQGLDCTFIDLDNPI